MDYSPPGSSVHGILEARILKQVAIPSSRRSSWPRDQTCVSYVSCIGRWVLYHKHYLGSQPIKSDDVHKNLLSAYYMLDILYDLSNLILTISISTNIIGVLPMRKQKHRD